ncbi:SDR family oxidoreductase [Allonocardiopsis opalescens]|uniref:NADP-dependent 3-hydroxy acid dehydrogenase YdfG n=1 Tax=Allonocardiopsis opalescens TaxID=1144618 RepID=A0A2T0PXS7_9ACTN|nr:SDR family oxidoreductase [Allonocardiopsis opalescens]PRX96351.1 NADP-dependent 3-hydroxy acid dehydrogenase YdfG [Allonocardiopsis opalescens]
MDTLKGTTAFITGAARGVGLGIARSLARRGCALALTDLDAEALDTAAAELAATARVRVFRLDVRDRAGFARVADEAEEALGPVSVLCNNAGIAFPETAEDMAYELWDLALDINLGGVVNGVQTFLPRMLARGGPGHIVNTASAAGLVARTGPMYTASKFAVVGLSESLRGQLEAAGHPVGVTVLCPGGVASAIGASTRAVLDAAHGGPAFERARTRLRRAAPAIDSTLAEMGVAPDRVGEQVADAVLADRSHVLTDRAGIDLIRARTATLLASMPAADTTDATFERFRSAVGEDGR